MAVTVVVMGHNFCGTVVLLGFISDGTDEDGYVKSDSINLFSTYRPSADDLQKGSPSAYEPSTDVLTLSRIFRCYYFRERLNGWQHLSRV